MLQICRVKGIQSLFQQAENLAIVIKFTYEQILLQQDQVAHQLFPDSDVIIPICQSLRLPAKDSWQERMKNQPINELLCTQLVENQWLFHHLFSKAALES